MARKEGKVARSRDPFDDLGEEIERRVQMKIAEKMGGRDNAVMTRLSDDDLQKIDALVELDVFRSRSEAVAFLVREGMRARADLIESVMPTIEKIRELKETARRSIQSEDRRPTAADADAKDVTQE